MKKFKTGVFLLAIGLLLTGSGASCASGGDGGSSKAGGAASLSGASYDSALTASDGASGGEASGALSAGGSSSGSGASRTPSGGTGGKNTGAASSGGAGPSTPEPEPTFHVDMSGLPKKTLYLIDNQVFNAGNGGILQHDTVRLVASLQGLINRDFHKNQVMLYFSYDSADAFWLNQLTAGGGILQGYSKVTVDTLTEFLEIFKKQLVACGMILWDPAVPSTANVAATICGLDGYLPVKADARPAGLQARLAALGVKAKQSLTGKFKGKGIIPDTKLASSGSAKCDAYLWAMDKYLNRCSVRYITYMPDGAGCVETNDIYIKDADAKSAFGNSLFNHDYLIARQCFFFDLSPVDSEAPCDDLKQPVGADVKVLRQILKKQYERNKGAFSQIIGFPPWWIKYTTHNGWGSLAATTVEWLFADIISQNNMAKEADAAQPCCMTNGSVYCQVPLKSSLKNTNRPAKITEKFNANTVYCIYFMGDYDSSAWLKKWVPVIWQDANKGKLPMMWPFNPNLSERVPNVFNYVYSHMDSKDYFTAGDSGAGYILPAALYKEYAPERTMPNGDSAWIAYNKPFFQRFDLDIVGFIINGNYKMNSAIMKMYNQFAPVGSFHNDSSKPLSIAGGVPYIHLKNGVGNPGDAGQAQGMYDYIKTTMKGYNFAGFRTICYTPTQVNDLTNRFLAYAADKDPSTTYKFVDPYTFFEMIRQSGQGVKLS